MLADYILFLLKGLTIVLLFVGVLSAIGYLIARLKELNASDDGSISITDLTDEYDGIRDHLEEETLDPSDLKAKKAERKKEAKQKKRNKASTENEQESKRVFIANFTGDLEASGVHELKEVISAILMTASSQDEVVITVESAGGYVQNYGYAASQIKRVTDRSIPCTICVDTVAASGGYLMACVADKIIASPFAIVGSIGVIAEIPNFHRLLKKYDIEYEQHTAGQYKSTLSMFAENTKEGRLKFKEELGQTHQLFKEFVSQNRENVDIEKISTGEYWHAQQAQSLGLVDMISTSDDYLMTLWRKGFSLYKVSYSEKKHFWDALSDKLGLAARKTLNQFFAR